MSFLWRAANRTIVPLGSVALLSSNYYSTKCEAVPVEKEEKPVEKEELYHGLFPKRQLWKPDLEYPLWDKNWDQREPESTGDKEEDHKRARHIRKNGVTKHIILVRHGQYDETHKEDEKRVLTPLGERQAELTGQRLAEMLKGAEGEFKPCNITKLRVSNMTRAKQTADIIAKYIPQVDREEPDAALNEGRPCHHIPSGRVDKKVIKATDEGHERIEGSFKKYFYRAEFEGANPEDDDKTEDASCKESSGGEKHEFEIIVCHANVIRYFLMRALQLPPEAWLRYCPFNCSITYVTIRPTGTVSCRMLGDIGHLPYNASTFSGHHGYNW